MLLQREYTFLGRYDAIHGCPGPWAMAGTLRGQSVYYGCVRNARYITEIELQLPKLYTRRVVLQYEYAYPGRCHAIHGCPGP